MNIDRKKSQPEFYSAVSRGMNTCS